MGFMGIYDRTKLLLTDDEFCRLRSAHVLIVGVGGVGGYAVEMLARAGVGALTLVDGDRINVTNINRQIIADSTNIGEYKCNAFKERITRINPEINVRVLNLRYNESTDNAIFDSNYSYVIDAIDSVDDKVSLIVSTHNRKIPIISAMGAGNRLEISDFAVTDIFKTSYDKLAKKMRKLLKDKGINKHTVVCCNTESTRVSGGQIGSISYMPALAGVKLGAYVINEIIKGMDKNS